MSLLGNLLAAAGAVGKAAVAVADETVATATTGINEWVENRATERRLNEFDADLEKAGRKEAERLEHEEASGGPQGGQGGKGGGKDGGGAGDQGEPPKDQGHALIFDPFDMVTGVGYRERPSSLTYGAMEVIGRAVPVVADVINTRANQVCAFTHLPEDRHSPGFKVRLRDWRNQTITKATEKEAQRLASLLLTTGYVGDKRPNPMTFTEFTRMSLTDSLIFDQGCFEKIPDRKGRVSYLQPVDASTIRLLDPGIHGENDKQAGRDDPFAVQLIHGSIVADFTREELAFCIRNPRTGIRSYGYGMSEIETLVREITGFLWAMDYNRKFFSQGSATKGILNFKGTIPDRHLKAFRRQWYSMVAGVQNAWRTPITNAEELQWISMQLTNRDMEYNAWMDFLIKIVCARYLIAPEEVQFQYGNTGQSQAMGSAPVEEKIKASKDLGLRPLTRWWFEQVSRHFITPLNEDFEVVPVGLDAKGAEAETELLSKQQAFFLTIDEARETVELEPLGDEKGGSLIMSPTYLQYIQGKEAAAQGAPGEDGAGGDGAPGEDAPGGDDDANPGFFSVTPDDEDEDEDQPQVDGKDAPAVKSNHPDRAHFVRDL